MHIYRLITFCDPVSLRTARLLSFFSFFSAAFPGLALACIDSRARDASVIRYTFATPRLRFKTRRPRAHLVGLLLLLLLGVGELILLDFRFRRHGLYTYIRMRACVRACVALCRADAADDSPSHHPSVSHPSVVGAPTIIDVSRRVFYHETHRRNRDTIRTHGIARPGAHASRSASTARRSTARKTNPGKNQGNKTTRSVGHADPWSVFECFTLRQRARATTTAGVARQHRARRASRTAARERR